MTSSRVARAAGAVLVSLGIAFGFAPPTVMAADVTFGTPSGTATYSTGVTFVQPVNVAGVIRRAELLIALPNELGPHLHEIPVPTATGAVTLRGDWSDAKDGHLLPNTPLVAHWRITPAAGEPVDGPPVTVLYADTRFAWRTIAGSLVRLHWYEGSDAFARQALALGEQGVSKAADLLGVHETEPIDFFVYAAQAPFYDALGLSPGAMIAGEAHAEIRTMFANIDPGTAIDPTVASVIPHELTHLVFNTAVRNPYHFPPRWLNEGLAVYLSEGYSTYWRAAVEEAELGRTMLSLAALDGQFPPPDFGFRLAYGESVSAVDFFVRNYGKDHLVALIRSYADGRTDDEAFKAAIGVDVPGFEAAWLADLGATAPTRYGPQPAPTGSLPPGWGDAVASAAPAAATSGGAASPATSIGAAPGGSATPAGTATGDSAGGGPILLLIAAAGLVVGGLLGLARRRRRPLAVDRPDPDPPPEARP